MTYLFFTDELSEKNGWGRYALDLSTSLQKQGKEVLVICHRKNESFPEIKQEELLFNPLSYRFNYLLFWLVVLRIYFLPGHRDFKVVHTLVETYAPVAWFLSLILKKNFYLTIHGSFGLKPLAYLWPGIFQRFIYRNKRVRIICISNYTKGRLSSRLNFPFKAEIIPNGVDLSNMHSEGPLAGPKSPLALLGVGALKQRKGFHLIVEALPKVIKFFPELKYLIVGNQKDFVYVNNLKKRIAELGLDDHINFFQNISDEKLKELYHLASLFVLTPLSDEYNFEGFGLVYLEANSFGLPVLGMKGNGGEEAISHGETGLLSETGDINSIAASILKILGDKETYVMMSAKALVWAKDHDWAIIVKRYLDFYDRG